MYDVPSAVHTVGLKKPGVGMNVLTASGMNNYLKALSVILYLALLAAMVIDYVQTRQSDEQIRDCYSYRGVPTTTTSGMYVSCTFTDRT